MLFIYFISELFLTVLVMLPTCFATVLNWLVTKLSYLTRSFFLILLPC